LTVDDSGEAGWEAGGAKSIDGLSDAKSIDQHSVGLGSNALRVGAAVKYNTAVGNSAGYTNVNGTENIYMGNSAGYTSTGSSNVFLGASSGYRGTTGSNNTYVGKGAGLGWVFDPPTGNSNTAIGHESLKVIAGAAAQNTAIGKDAGVAVTTGSNNTFLGYLAGNTTTTSTNNTLLGYDAEASSATVSNEITLGNASVTKFRIPGMDFVIDAGNVGITGTLSSTGTHTVGTNSSGNSATLQQTNIFQFKLNGDTASQLGIVSWVNNSGATTGNLWATGDSSSSGIIRLKGIGNIDLVAGNVGIDATAAQLRVNTSRVDLSVPMQLPSYTVAGLPTGAAGDMAYCSNETGGAVIVFSDGTNWRRSTDRAVAA
jgi:trimeric autotransporter adhesin